ncbi:MAG: hypothetical protein KAQ98_10400 [Bacteriovoracaceae bacterium]|nr:hypothetical protein [Bacteriovoracaceae bacterium]
MDSGGGDVIACRRGLPLIGPMDYYLADTYKIAIEDGLKDFPSVPEEIFLDSLIKQLNNITNGLGDAISSRLSEMKFIYVDKKLPELDDDNISKRWIGKRCKKIQLAIQQIPKKEVRINNKLYKKLSSIEKVLFKIHEALISLRNTSGDTTQIRDKVFDTINCDNFENFLYQTILKKKYVPIFYLEKIRMIGMKLWIMGLFYHFHNKVWNDFKVINLQSSAYIRNITGTTSAHRASQISYFHNINALLPVDNIISRQHWIEALKSSKTILDVAIHMEPKLKWRYVKIDSLPFKEKPTLPELIENTISWIKELGRFKDGGEEFLRDRAQNYLYLVSPPLTE